MASPDLLFTSKEFTPYRASLSSFGSQADGKVIKKGTVTLQGTVNGSVWTTLASDTYYIRKRTGALEKRQQDDSGADIDWQIYFAYQDAGSQAFRCTYTTKNGETLTVTTNESVTFAETDPYQNDGSDGSSDGELANNLFVDEVHAELGDIGGWTIDSTTISSDNGKVVLDATQKALRLGNATDYNGGGTGVFLGKSSGTYVFRIGAQPNSGLDSFYWDGSNLYDTGRKIGGTVGGATVSSTKIYIGTGTYANTNTAFYVDSTGQMSLKDKLTWDGSTLSISGTLTATAGTIGGWTLGATALTAGSGANTVGLDSGGTNPALYAGSATPASAPFRVTKAGALTATNATITGTITASAGAIGGFTIGSDNIQDAANSFGLASTVTGGDDVRIWVGDTFSNRATAPFQVYESGYIFAKDIVLAKGALTNASGATGYGYAVDPLFLCHYDGARPFEGDYTGSTIGHKGQVGTFKWGGTEGRGLFQQGLYNKAVQISEATTNLCTNPSFETNTTSWTQIGSDAPTRDSTYSKYGGFALKVGDVSVAIGNGGASYALAITSGTSYTFSGWVYIPSSQPTLTSAVANILDGSSVQQAITTFTTTANNTRDQWFRISVSFTASSTATHTFRFVFGSASAHNEWIDGIQIEAKAYVTGYCDGSLGDGHTWSGTAHASTSSRTAATLTYPASGNINLVQGSVSLWYYQNPTVASAERVFGARIDASNLLEIRLSPGGFLTPIALSVSGGSSVDTNTAPATAAEGWHHLCMTWTTGALKIYMDGAQSGVTATYVIPVGTLSTFEVGSINLANQCNTRIDDLAILPIVLTDHEIKSIYYSDAPLMLGVSNQELRLSGAGLGDVFGNANGLFGRDSSGNASFGILNGTVNATTWGGASESFDSGDFLFGSNKSGKSNLFFDASVGSLQLRTATTKKIDLQTDGDVFIGTDTSAAATTNLSLFANNQTYNSESVVAGDILIGDNSAGQSNVLWDATTGFQFRDGTTAINTLNDFGIITQRAIGHAQTTITVVAGAQDIDDGTGNMFTSYLRISTAGGNFTINRIAAASVLGQRLLIHNNTASNMTIADGVASGGGYQKCVTFTGGSVSTTGDGMAEFIYNDTNSRWDLISIRG